MAKKMGRPSALTPEVQKVIVNALNAGSFIDAACEMAGIDSKTFYTWIKRGKADKNSPYNDFLLAVKKALANAEVGLVGTIRTASKQQWQAAAWILERRFPARWAKTSEKPVVGETSSAEESARKIVWTAPEPTPSEPSK